MLLSHIDVSLIPSLPESNGEKCPWMRIKKKIHFTDCMFSLNIFLNSIDYSLIKLSISLVFFYEGVWDTQLIFYYQE